MIIPLLVVMASIGTTGHFDCSNSSQVSQIALLVAANHTWINNKYDCTQFAYALGNELKYLNCTFRMATGWNAPPRTQGRGWHRWVETPYFSINAENGGINPNYQKSYATAWNWSHEYG